MSPVRALVLMRTLPSHSDYNYSALHRNLSLHRSLVLSCPRVHTWQSRLRQTDVHEDSARTHGSSALQRFLQGESRIFTLTPSLTECSVCRTFSSSVVAIATGAQICCGESLCFMSCTSLFPSTVPRSIPELLARLSIPLKGTHSAAR